MNIAEKLAEEIQRVTEVKSQFERMRGMPNVIVEPQIAMLQQSLKAAQRAAGSGNAHEVMTALKDLKEWEG